MIVSHRHRFIFLKTRKTAGTSVEVALSPFCGPADIITPIAPEDEAVRERLGFGSPQNYCVPLRQYHRRHWRKLLLRRRWTYFYHHMPAREAKSFLGDRVWKSYYKFAFERNPWDRIVSAYFWHKYQSGDDQLSFQDFLMRQPPRILSNYDIYAIDGRMGVDFLGRYEDLARDFGTALKTIGINEPVELPRLKGKARTDRRPYSEVMTRAQQEYVAARCAREISIMDYRFS